MQGKRAVGTVLGLITAVSLFAGVTAAQAAVPSTTVYDATPSPLPPNVASVGFEATRWLRRRDGSGPMRCSACCSLSVVSPH